MSAIERLEAAAMFRAGRVPWAELNNSLRSESRYAILRQLTGCFSGGRNRSSDPPLGRNQEA